MDDKKFKNRFITMIKNKISELLEARHQPHVLESTKRDIDAQIKAFKDSIKLAEKIDAQVEEP